MQKVFVLALSLCACSTGDEWRPARPGEIFRYTSIGRVPPYDSILLGQRWASAAKYGAGPGDTITALPPGTFAGADGIRIRRLSNGVVTSIEFDYRGQRDIEAIRRDYESKLGAPVGLQLRGGRRTTIWRDSLTEFSLQEFGVRGDDAVAATAILADRARQSRSANDRLEMQR
jgi:hypothetical protein